MIDEQTLRVLIEAGGVGGTILGVVALLRAVFLKWLDNISQARQLDAQRESAERANEQALALALNGVTTELKLSRGIHEQMLERYDLLATSAQLDRVHANVKTIPAEVWRLGDPKLDTMKTDIEDRITELQATIEQRLPVDATNAREAIRLEFEEMNKRLDDLDKTLRTFTPKQNTKNPARVVGYLENQTKTQEK